MFTFTHYSILMVYIQYLANPTSQAQDNSNQADTDQRQTKGHKRNKSNGSGIALASGHFHPGAFQPGHKRSVSVLSKISRLSVRTLGKPSISLFKIKYTEFV